MGGSVQRAQRPGRIALYGAASPLCNRDASRHRAAEGAASRPMRVTIAPAPPVAILSPPRNGTVASRARHSHGFQIKHELWAFHSAALPNGWCLPRARAAPRMRRMPCRTSAVHAEPPPIPMPWCWTLFSVARRAGRSPGRCCSRIHPGFHCPRCRRALLIRLVNGVAP